jgi:hypothetical protein
MKIARPWWGETPEKPMGFHGACWFWKNLKGLLGRCAAEPLVYSGFS